MARTFYRIVQTNPPTEQDFRSFQALGRRLRHPNRQLERLASGVSMYDTEEHSRAIARGARGALLGRYIAAVEIPDDSPIRVEKTLGPGHYTVWGEPAALLACVARVVPV